jgi:hypothetical protein
MSLLLYASLLDRRISDRSSGLSKLTKDPVEIQLRRYRNPAEEV